MPRKDFSRDYATEAFRFYAKCGKPTYEELRQKMFDEAFSLQKNEYSEVKSGISKPTEQAVLMAEKAVEQKKAELLDIKAVQFVLWRLEQDKKNIIIECLERIYFADADKELQKGDIARRVVKASMALPMSERQIYRYLQLARHLFCEERGIRYKNFSKDVSTST